MSSTLNYSEVTSEIEAPTCSKIRVIVSEDGDVVDSLIVKIKSSPQYAHLHARDAHFRISRFLRSFVSDTYWRKFEGPRLTRKAIVNSLGRNGGSYDDALVLGLQLGVASDGVTLFWASHGSDETVTGWLSEQRR